MNDDNFQRQQEFNNAADRIANQLAKEKRRDRKHLLKIEIAQATNRATKAELQEMLYEIEEEERKNKRNVYIFLIILLLIAAISYPLVIKPFINKSTENNVEAIYSSSEPAVADSTNIINDSEEITSKSSVVASSTATSESTKFSSESDEMIDNKNLSTDQVEQWVRAVMDKKYSNMTNKINYGVDVTVGEDGLVYITVTPPADLQVDTLDNFRINNNGVLEEAGYYQGKPGEWIPVSDQFLDTSKIDPTVSSTSNQNLSGNNSNILSFDSAVEYLKANKNIWTYSRKNADTVEIISINVNDKELKTDSDGSYYSVVINTNDDDGSVTGGGKQFRVYTDGMIKQRAGMHDFYTILD